MYRLFGKGSLVWAVSSTQEARYNIRYTVQDRLRLGCGLECHFFRFQNLRAAGVKQTVGSERERIVEKAIFFVLM